MYKLQKRNITATPEKYPQRYFKEKPCKRCGAEFAPQAPSHLYCSQACFDKSQADSYLEKTYGITLADYRLMLYDQDHKCAICGGEGFHMKGSKHGVKLVVDHDHKTGAIRGLLCHNCNRALGLLQDSPEVTAKAVAYLEGATTILDRSSYECSEAHGPSYEGDDIV